jgi:hypothetical protein
LKHGRYTEEALRWRRSVAELIRTARQMKVLSTSAKR